MVSDYATLRLEEDLSTDERPLQLFRDAEKKRQSRQLTRLWLVVFSVGIGLLMAKLYSMGGSR
jgi:hypothetical protein